MNQTKEDPLTSEMLKDKFSVLEASPKDDGSVDLIVARPTNNKRITLTEADITIEQGLVGDRWGKRKSKKSNYALKTQITLMNSKIIEMIAGDKENWIKAGDQLFVNLDLSERNLPVGQKIGFGSNCDVILEISDTSHTGCSKFSKRYGKDALEFISAPERKDLRLRGIYAKVLKSGKVKLNDIIRKI